MKKFSIVATPTKLTEVFTRGCSVHELYALLRKMYNFDSVHAFSSGAAALYVLLLALKKQYKKTEVVLPVYTATAVLFPILKAGLKPIFCDMTIDSFNSEIVDLKSKITEDTLCVLPTHMFGFPVEEINSIKEQIDNTFVVEDVCQAQGAIVDGRLLGSFADASLFSFNRGKNIPAFGGGAFLVVDGMLNAATEEIIEEIPFEIPSFFRKFFSAAKNIILSIVVRPGLYCFISPLINFLRERPTSQEVHIGLFTGYQANVVRKLLFRIDSLSAQRFEHGSRIISLLADNDGVEVPNIKEGTRPAFNRMPIVFKDLNRLEETEKGLAKAGFETSRMYFQPLHLMFPDLGYKKGDFPNAEYFAEHLLTVPCHPLMSDKDIDKMIKIIKNSL